MIRVGADAHIGPAETADFPKIQCEFATFFGPMWASAPTHYEHFDIDQLVEAVDVTDTLLTNKKSEKKKKP